MKSYFLKNIFMNNLFKSVILASALTVSPVSADNQKSTFATTVAINGEGIDFKSKIATINSQIQNIQEKINFIQEKKNLNEADQLNWLSFINSIDKLTAERDVIRDKINNAKQNKSIIINNDTQLTDKNLAIEDVNLATEKNNVAIEDKKLAIINAQIKAKIDDIITSLSQ